jgi:parallel beta-helix repeat protein
MRTPAIVVLLCWSACALALGDSERSDKGTSSTAATLLRVPQEYSTIQAAIDASVDGDTVLVAEGTYLENIRYRGKAIVVGSLYIMDGDAAHIGKTIIDGSFPSDKDNASTVSFVDGEDTSSVLTGFTIQGGAGTKMFFYSFWYRLGGGVCCLNAGGRITNNIITSNRIAADGVLGAGVGAYAEQLVLPYVILEGNGIIDNSAREDAATEVGSGGGGATLTGVNCRVQNNLFERNAVTGIAVAGGGVTVAGMPPGSGYPVPAAIIRGNTIRENTATAVAEKGVVGAGMAVVWTADVSIEENLFEGNIATSVAGWAEGGGLAVDDHGVAGIGRKMIVGNRFERNRCSWGSTQYSECGAGLFLYHTIATVSQNTIVDNTANGSGGGIAAYRSSFRIENNIISRNSGCIYGGGLDVKYNPIAGTEQLVVNNTVVGNRARWGGGMTARGELAKVVSLNNIFWADSAQAINEILVDVGAAAAIHYCDVQGGWPSGEGNIDADPRFMESDPLFQLTPESPCIGRGTDSMLVDGVCYCAPTCDCDGHCRPGPGHDQGPDIGAQEEGSTLGVGEAGELPLASILYQNYPNPFNPSTTISYALPVRCHVTLVVYSTLGEKVTTLVQGEQEAGNHQVQFEAAGYASGVYLYRLEVGDFVQVRRLVLVR